MRTAIKVLIIMTLISLIGYAIYYYNGLLINTYNFKRDAYKTHMKYFQDSIKVHLDTSYNMGFMRESDIFSFTEYNNEIYIALWEFKNKNESHLENINFRSNSDLNGIEFERYEKLYKGGSPEITVKLNSQLNDTINIHLDNALLIEKSIVGDNFKAVYGKFNNIALSDGNDEYSVLVNFLESNKFTMVCCYSFNKSFVLIFLRSVNKLDENILRIFKFPNSKYG